MNTKEHTLILDSSIRDWVLLPMLLLLILVGVGRHYVALLIKSTPKITEQTLNEARYRMTLMRSMRVRQFGHAICETAFNTRKIAMLKKKTGLLREKVPGASNPMSNPNAMMDMMKGNITGIVPNIAMMTFVGWFFAGFICLKVPFPIPSSHFKIMFQRGVDLSTLDISYVSSLSWYFLCSFGLNGVYKIILGQDSELDDSQMQMMQMQMQMGGGSPMGFDASTAYKQEIEQLSIAKHEWSAERAERALLGDKYPEKTKASIDLSRMKKTSSLM